MTKQPVWQYLDNLGDATPLEYGGDFVFEDTTGVYPPELEHYDPDDGRAYRVVLERLALVDGILVLDRIAANQKKLPHPLASYEVWFSKHLAGIASACGTSQETLIAWLTSGNIIARAQAYIEIGLVEGWENLDGYPLVLAPGEAYERYKELPGVWPDVLDE